MLVGGGKEPTVRGEYALIGVCPRFVRVAPRVLRHGIQPGAAIGGDEAQDVTVWRVGKVPDCDIDVHPAVGASRLEHNHANTSGLVMPRFGSYHQVSILRVEHDLSNVALGIHG